MYEEPTRSEQNTNQCCQINARFYLALSALTGGEGWGEVGGKVSVIIPP